MIIFRIIFYNVPLGSYRVVVKSDGFLSFSKDVTLLSSHEVQVVNGKLIWGDGNIV